MFKLRYLLVALVLLILASLTHAEPILEGVNLAGAEFAHGTFWPNTEEIEYFQSKGMNVLRLPFLWERLQPSLFGDFNAAQLNGLDTFVTEATNRGVHVILDPHNYARYNGQLIGSSAVPDTAFADLWSRLATLYQGNARVVFGLMNEPNNMSTEQWRASANTAIAAIRATGATNLILVPGNAWTGAHSWEQNWYGTPNAVEMLNIVDPGNNFVFELHQYFDSNFSGTSPVCVPGNGSTQLVTVTNWLRQHGYVGFLGEFAGANNADCRAAIEDALGYLEANADVWLGWTWWAAGPEWGEYIFTLEPTNNYTVDRPQMAWLTPFLGTIFSDGFESGDVSRWSSSVD
ncbi:MAG: glycoside hydrolase family 5 protein [Acidobacteriota bacterium]